MKLSQDEIVTISNSTNCSIKILGKESQTILPDINVSSFASKGGYRGTFCAGNSSITCRSSLSPRLQSFQNEMAVRNSQNGSHWGSKGQIDSTSERDEDELTIKISKETKPMMHLLRLLKENYKNGIEVGSDDPKGRAVTSLINDFEKEVSSIEHRIKGQFSIMNGEQSPLPPDWIALEDMHSGEIYYANEVTGDTQWERPCLGDRAGKISDNMTNYSNDSNFVKGSHNSVQNFNRGNNYLQSSQKGTFEYSHQRIYGCNMVSNYQCNFGNNRPSSIFNFDNSNIDNYNQENVRGCIKSKGRQINMRNANTILTHRNSILNEKLPQGWIALEDANSGETYFANEITGESTWDKPKIQQIEKDSDDNFPPGWIALEDADSGETYYLNQVTMATTWERPSEGNGSEIEARNGEKQSSENGRLSYNNGDLPPGWEAVLDPSSGDYYFAHESGKSQWELPEFDQAEYGVAFDTSGEKARSVGNNRFDSPLDGILLPGWFAALDEDSGDHYYSNEMTGETTWDIPTDLAAVHDNPNDPDQALVVEEVEDDYHDIPPSWFAVTNPDSADLYFCNEQTGETTWDHRTTSISGAASKDANEQYLISRLTINDNTVYEDDSVSSSRY
ncbi:hypothetical protein ACHAXA_009308 [Cyclostephanos tholiformis]|uniref:WW domain-containing protein n=1 Tax=Cyclostephanos tholiformis TaxID=382380 RepID=A0ABD3RUZ9_9STRA